MAWHSSERREWDRDGGGWWDGNRHESRAERGSLAESLQSGQPSNSVFCLYCGSLFPSYLSFCHSVPFFLVCSTSPLPPTWVSVPSLALCLATSVLILSASSQLQLQLLTAHHLGLDHHPLIWLHCVKGLLGSHSHTDDPISLCNKKGTDPYLYYSSYWHWREGLWGEKKILLSYRRPVYDDGLLNTHLTQVWDCCRSLISRHHFSQSLQL